jgi:hypothetical protein
VDSSLASQLPQGLGNAQNVCSAKICGSWLASDGDVTVGARLELLSPLRCMNDLENRVYLYPAHHLISLMRHFALFLCANRLLQSGSISSNDNKFAETFP